jgi:RHS repeat-associated protein
VSLCTYDSAVFIYDDVPRCASQFTGKERDSETGLDYFGARYYGSNMGRWMSAGGAPFLCGVYLHLKSRETELIVPYPSARYRGPRRAQLAGVIQRGGWGG